MKPQWFNYSNIYIECRDTLNQEEVRGYQQEPSKFPIHIKLLNALSVLDFNPENWVALQSISTERNFYCHSVWEGVDAEKATEVYIKTVCPPKPLERALRALAEF